MHGLLDHSESKSEGLQNVATGINSHSGCNDDTSHKPR